MRILLIGSGGREHALAWKLAQSPSLEQLFASPGNPGIYEHAKAADIAPTDHLAVVSFCRNEKIDLVVVGPEQPLVDGLSDTLRDAGIAVFGPSAAAAQLEGSKQFTKALCSEAGIPTAWYRYFTDEADAAEYIRNSGGRIVIKADGLAAGKGVTVADTVEQALAANTAIFAEPKASVVIEERLSGVEASLFALSDGNTVIPFGTAQDYKRALDKDLGPNTGGMGAISPAPALTTPLLEQAMSEIVRPTVSAMKARGTPYRGVLYAGLMLTADGPKLIEYNVRFGDPECQVLMPRLRSDLAEILMAAAAGALDGVEPDWSGETAVTITMANKGYPGAYEKGSEIRALGAVKEIEGCLVFQAGTSTEGERLLATGGRVLNATAVGGSPAVARERAYAAVSSVDWPEGTFRRDIAANV